MRLTITFIVAACRAPECDVRQLVYEELDGADGIVDCSTPYAGSTEFDPTCLRAANRAQNPFVVVWRPRVIDYGSTYGLVGRHRGAEWALTWIERSDGFLGAGGEVRIDTCMALEPDPHERFGHRCVDRAQRDAYECD